LKREETLAMNNAKVETRYRPETIAIGPHRPLSVGTSRG
jgi:hypothetical protein